MPPDLRVLELQLQEFIAVNIPLEYKLDKAVCVLP